MDIEVAVGNGQLIANYGCLLNFVSYLGHRNESENCIEMEMSDSKYLNFSHRSSKLSTLLGTCTNYRFRR